MNLNPECCGSHCRAEHGEVRVYPLGGGGNLILCRSCWSHENAYRADRGGPPNWPLIPWSLARVYEAAL
jgi:hypothetical protein